MRRAQNIQIVGAILLVGFIANLIQNIYLYHHGFVDNIFMFVISKPGMFDDFTNVSVYVQHNDPYQLKDAVVSPFPFLFRFSTLFAYLPVSLSISVYLGLFLSAFGYYVYSEIKVGNTGDDMKNLLLFTVFSYPFLFSLNRGNYEMIVFLFVAYFIRFYAEQKRALSFIMLTLALSLKPFPVVFLALYFSDKRYKEMLIIPMVAVVVTLASYASFSGGLIHNIRLHQLALGFYNRDYAVGNGGMTYGHSLFGLVKTFIAYFHPTQLHSESAILFGYYGKMMFFWAAFTGLYVAFVEKILWRRVALLVFIMDLFPYVSADYKLMYLYIPLFLLLNRRETDRGDSLFVILLAVLLVPKSYYYYKFADAAQIVPYVVTSAALLNPLLMLAGYFILISLGLRDWLVRFRLWNYIASAKASGEDSAVVV